MGEQWGAVVHMHPPHSIGSQGGAAAVNCDGWAPLALVLH